MNECSNQQTLGIIVLPIHKELENLDLVSVLQLVFELQPLFDVAVMKELANDLCSVNTPPLSSTEVYMED